MLSLLAALLAGACESGTYTSYGDPSSSGAGPEAPVGIGPGLTLGERQLRLGWNLGNSLDAWDGETSWGNPRVTAELLEAVAVAGFDLVRIPVTWTFHMGEAPDYRIDPEWLARVDEVVSYAEEAGLVVVLNLHHDGSSGDPVQWLTLHDADGSISEENNRAVEARFAAVWRQIAEHFEPHGEALVLESMNEIFDGDGADSRYFEIVNDLNQVFVDTVRATGGNNTARYLLLPGYYNINFQGLVTGFRVPEDSVEGRVILSAHYYHPYLFSIAAETRTWGSASPGSDDWGQEAEVVEDFDKLKRRFVDEGVPVMLGEFGAVQQDGFERYRRYYLEYLTKVASDRGILPVYWDNGRQGSGPERFALFDRETAEITQPEIVDTLYRDATRSYLLRDVQLPLQ